MAKYKIYVNGNNNQQNNAQASQVMQQMAQNVVNQQAQSQPEEDMTRQTVNELVKSTLLNPVEVPKYTTIKDVLDAPKGNKLTTFAEFLNNPETMRTIGDLMPYYGYNPNTGRGNNVMETPARRQEALMKAEQSKALEQQKQQNAVLNNVYNAYKQMDIADIQDKRARELAEMQNKWQKERFAQEMALRREQLNSQIQHQRAMEGIARDRLSSNSKQEKQLQKNIDALNSLNAVQSQMDRFSNSFKDVRPTKMGALMAGAVADRGWGNKAEANFNSQRTLLFNKIARELGGEKGVLSDQDIKRIETSLPALSDSYDQKKAKMQAIYDLLDDRKSQYGGAVSAGMASQLNNDPLGLGF